MNEQQPKPPSSLPPDGDGEEFWRACVEGFEVERTDLPALELAATALDRIAEARLLVERDGLLVVGPRGALRANPALAVEAAARRQYLQAARALNLEADTGSRQARTLGGRFAGSAIGRAS